jgi:hypothetical protein
MQCTFQATSHKSYPTQVETSVFQSTLNMRRRESGDEVDCIDKKCFLVHQLKPICVIPLPTNNTFCNIPCLTSGCDQETHRSIVCPIWLCKPIPTTSTSSTTTASSTSPSTSRTTKSTTKPTTVSSTTTSKTTLTTVLSTTLATSTTTLITTETSQISTVSPLPIPISCHSLLMFLSLGFNVLLLVALLSVLFSYWKLKREDREFEAEIERRLGGPVNRFTGQVGHFSIGSLESLLRPGINFINVLRTAFTQTRRSQKR